MTDSSTWAGVGAIGAAVTAAATIGVQWLRNRPTKDTSASRDHGADQTARAAEVTAEASLVSSMLVRLADLDMRVDALRLHVDECEDGRRQDREVHSAERQADREDHERQRRDDRDGCEREIQELQDQIAEIASATADARASDVGESDTGVEQLRTIARRSNSSTTFQAILDTETEDET